jgi:TatD DNase family protein
MSIAEYFDVHTHVHFAAYENDSDEVIRRALEADVWLVNVGTQRDTSAGAVATAERYKEGVYAAIGLHPIHTEKSHHDEAELGLPDGAEAPFKGQFTSRGEDFDYDYYKSLALHPKVVAIGECGLDYYRLGEETKDRQFEAFEQQIAFAAEVGKPLMIHCRNAFSDLIALLKPRAYGLKPGIVHFFTGTVADARALLDLGFSFSFGGVTTFTSDYDEVLRFIPLERILSETDAPYVTPVPHRGKRNEPLYVREVVRRIAEIRGEDPEAVQIALMANALALFGLVA